MTIGPSTRLTPRFARPWWSDLFHLTTFHNIDWHENNPLVPCYCSSHSCCIVTGWEPFGLLSHHLSVAASSNQTCQSRYLRHGGLRIPSFTTWQPTTTARPGPYDRPPRQPPQQPVIPAPPPPLHTTSGLGTSFFGTGAMTPTRPNPPAPSFPPSPPAVWSTDTDFTAPPRLNTHQHPHSHDPPSTPCSHTWFSSTTPTSNQQQHESSTTTPSPPKPCTTRVSPPSPPRRAPPATPTVYVPDSNHFDTTVVYGPGMSAPPPGAKNAKSPAFLLNKSHSSIYSTTGGKAFGSNESRMAGPLGLRT